MNGFEFCVERSVKNGNELQKAETEGFGSADALLEGLAEALGVRDGQRPEKEDFVVNDHGLILLVFFIF